MTINRQKYYFISLLSIMMMIIFILLPGRFVQAQDAVFSQYYANSVYLNPAYAGSHLCTRAVANYRNQWPNFSNSFITYGVAIDTYVDKIRGGVAFMAVSDRVGGDIMQTNRFSAVYAYQMKLNYEARLNAGFEITYHQQSFNSANLIFRDMIDPVSGNINQGSSQENYLGNHTEIKPDFSFGLLFYYRENYFFGASAHHLVQPELDYFGNGEVQVLKRRITIHGGAALQIINPQLSAAREAWILYPTIMYTLQNNTHQLNAGLAIGRKPLTLGIWYRHNINNPDGFVFISGLSYKKFKFAYSYDLVLSRLKSVSGGAHEISITFLFNCRKKNQFEGTINCPEF